MTVVAHTSLRDRALHGRGSLLSRCLAAGLPVGSSCSGRGACGRCVLTILAGSDGLRPPTARELRVLARNGAGSDQRLSCQCPMPPPGANLVVTAGYW